MRTNLKKTSPENIKLIKRQYWQMELTHIKHFMKILKQTRKPARLAPTQPSKISGKLSIMSFYKPALYRLSLSAVIGFASIGSISAVAEDTSVSSSTSETAAVQRLSRLLAGTQSLSASFNQTTKATKNKALAKTTQAPKHLAGTHMNKHFTGTMAFARPSKFRWETKTPARQLIVSKSDTLWIYDPDLGQATQQQVDKQMANTPALLLSGSAKKISESFSVLQPDTSKDVFVLHPKNSDAAFERLAIAFIAGKPRSMVLHDALGQITTIKFTNLKINPKLSDATFSFKPPKGLDVIYQ